MFPPLRHLLFILILCCAFCRLLTVYAVAVSQQPTMLATVAPIVPSAVGIEPSVVVMVSAAMSKGRVCVTLGTP